MPADDIRKETAPPPPGTRPLLTKIAILVLVTFIAVFLLIINQVALSGQGFSGFAIVLGVLTAIAVLLVLLIVRDLVKPWGNRKSTGGG